MVAEGTEHTHSHCQAVNRAHAAVVEGQRYLDGLPPTPDGYNNPIEKVEDPFDLNNLRYREHVYFERQKKDVYLVPRLVEEFVTQMNNVDEKSDKLFVIGIGTGGTIAMKKSDPDDPNSALVPDLDFESIMRRTDPRLNDDFEVRGFNAFKTDSSQLEIDDVGDLAISMCYIWKNMKPSLRKRFGGFLIVHGTDTMPKSGGHLEMMLGPNMPFSVVHTGAQKTINEKINDAEGNIKASLYMLKMLHRNNNAESISVMGGKALLTAGMTKVSDHHAVAMATHMHRTVLDFGALPNPDVHKLPGWLRENPGTRRFNPIIYRGPNRIGELAAEMQEDARYIVAVTRLAARKAILLVTYGANTYDYEAVRIIAEEAARQNMPIFAVSPVNADPKLDVYAVGAELSKAGVMPLYMTREIARAKLMLAFAKHGDGRAMIEEFMGTNCLGEIPNAFSRKELEV